AAPSPAPTKRTRPLGLIAMIVAVLCLSVSSTLIKKAGAPGPTMAFWRMVGSSVLWTIILRVTEHRFVTRQELRRAILPGIAFGLNLTLFFTAVTHTTVANAEFIGTLTPIVLVPAGAILFKEHIDPRALLFGLVSVIGLSMVLFLAPPNGQASWTGNALAFCAMATWSTYLISSRKIRLNTSVAGFMASAMPIASLTILPIVSYNGDIVHLTWRATAYLVVLVLLAGTLAHGLIQFAQHSVAVGTMSLIQIAQPGIAAMWSVILLSTAIRSIQVVGMALVITGLVLMILQRQRSAPTATTGPN
ncbi:MAG: DMT family transporter, partial [Ilumatobacteraceae bacterium]